MAGSYYLLGPNGTYWACNSGLTPCVSAQVLNQSTDFCVLIELWPKIFYHDPEYVYHHYEGLTRYPREPVSITLALLLGGLTVGGITAGIGTGAAALAETSQFKLLQQAMHADLQALEESVSALEKSLTSLSEVVLQNRRGLDILFLREGGSVQPSRRNAVFTLITLAWLETIWQNLERGCASDNTFLSPPRVGMKECLTGPLGSPP